jgi:peptidoglycan/xylan/chitin deacetylase (PgdA/CDA1 family)
MILRALNREKVPAAGFVVQIKIEDKPSTYVILDDWVTRGHLLGNQTWGDVDFNLLTYDQFMEHVVDGQKFLKRISKSHPFNYRYFRFPLLHQGTEPKKAQKFLATLARAEYQVAHVTVKTADWVFNQPIVDYGSDPEKAATLKRLYLEHIAEMLDYSEKQSEKVFQRNITHILQLRCGIATATFLPDLIQLLRDRGYAFVSLPEALKDSAYASEDTYVGPLGLTFTDRIAATQGLEFHENSGVPSERDMRARVTKLAR